MGVCGGSCGNVNVKVTCNVVPLRLSTQMMYLVLAYQIHTYYTGNLNVHLHLVPSKELEKQPSDSIMAFYS